jgi:hypothetical protein
MGSLTIPDFGPLVAVLLLLATTIGIGGGK